MALDRPVKKDLAMSGEVTPPMGCGRPHTSFVPPNGGEK